MTLKRKLFTAGCILALGLVLAWPFHKSARDADGSPGALDRPVEMLRASNGDPIAANSFSPATLPSAPLQTAARMTSTGEAPSNPKTINGLESFDVANHPALADHEFLNSVDATLPTSPVTSDIRPAYTTVGDSIVPESQSTWRKEVVHIVVNGDTLEKLADRYLGDAGRALEIFDLNRDQLSNPHLLPIGAELRVPVGPDRILD